jgi:2-amino-4-hydroxy-6-hydroxymethyldihydropteridine diphosphokinase
MNKVFLGLGSNVGDREQNIKQAVQFLSEKIKNIKTAKIYISKAVGYEEQDDFLNTAVMGFTDMEVDELFEFVKEVEKRVGRKYRFRWGPREIDIDILFFNDLVYESENLQIPHPRIQERDFVLKPLSDLDKNFIHPVLKKDIKSLIDELKKENLSIIGEIE